MVVDRIFLWMFVALLFIATVALRSPMQAAYAQTIDVLQPPGDIRSDTTFGEIGDWFTLRTLEGEEMQFPEFQDRVLFVNFWATWCAPCVKEMPTILELAESMTDVDVAFLLISIDDDERLVRRFVKKHDLRGKVYLRGWETGASTFTAGIVPATFIVTTDGTIAYQHHGAADWNTDFIRRFLSAKALRE